VTEAAAEGDDSTLVEILSFLGEEDRRMLETIDRLYREHTALGATDHEIRMRVAETVPGAFWPIRNRISDAQFELVCECYPGAAGFAALLKRATQAILQNPPPVLPRLRRRR
jgi:hypothetical protein